MSAQKKTRETTINNDIAHILSENDIAGVVHRKVSPIAFSTWIRQLMQNWRQGTVASKGRADVSFSNKKPWKQKGTGRARAGSARSPLWRGGGVSFGPQPRVRTLKVSKKLCQGVLNNLLWHALDQGGIISLDWSLQGDQPKTSVAHEALKRAQLLDKKIMVLLPIEDRLHFASFTNIPRVQVLSFDEVNAYDLALADRWVVLKKDLEAFKQVVSRWT
jgi:large subunit ribosomal protein L4